MPIAEAQTLIDVLDARANAHPDKVAYRFLEDGEHETACLSYADLIRQSRSVAQALAYRFEQGSRIVVAHPPGLEFVSALWGCWAAGLTPIPAAPPQGRRLRERVLQILADACPAAVMGDLHELHADDWLAATEGKVAMVNVHGLLRDYKGSTLRGVDPAQIALLQYTSGSTSIPRGVIVRHSHLMANQHMIAHAMGHDANADFVSWLPPFHDMGLIGNLLQPIFIGSTCTFMPPAAFLRRPLRWLTAISSYKAQTSGAPNFGFELCIDALKKERDVELDLSSWRVAYSGAEPVRRSTLDRFASAFARFGFRAESFLPTYGLAEATLMVSGRRACGARRLGEAGSVSCGPAVAPGSVAIVDPETCRRLPDRAIGEVWVTGPHVCAGYWNNEPDTRRVFQGQLESGGATYLRTGDLGYIESDELFISGRLKDQIIVRGVNFDPHDIELAVIHTAAAEGAHRALAAIQLAEGERSVVLLFEGTSNEAASWRHRATDIRQEVARRLQIPLDAAVLVRAGTLPRTSSGKIQRVRCRDLFAQGLLRVIEQVRFDTDRPWGAHAISDMASVPAADRSEWILGAIRHRAASLLGLAAQDLDATASLAVYGWDSLAALTLTHDLEAHFGVALPERLSLLDHSLTSLAQVVAQRVECAPARPALAPVASAVGSASGMPLSVGQQGFWFLTRLAPQSCAFNLPLVAALEGGIDSGALQRSFDHCVGLHAVWCSTLRWEAGGYRQVPLPDAGRPRLATVDARSWSPVALHRLLDELTRQPFDLVAQCPIRGALVQTANGWMLVLCAHHLAADFRSLCVLLSDLSTVYSHVVNARPIPRFALGKPFGDFIARERALLASPRCGELRGFWRKRLERHLEPLELPWRKPPGAGPVETGAMLHRRLDPGDARTIDRLARAYQTTQFVVCLTLFAIVLHKHSERRRFVIGTPAGLRPDAGFARTAGYLVNVLPLPVSLEGDPSFESLARQLHRLVADCVEHAELPFAEIVDAVGLPREPGRIPLVDVLFSWQKSPLPEAPGLTGFALRRPGAIADLGPFALRAAETPALDPQYDISLSMGREDSELWMSLEYRPAQFEATAMEQLLRDFAEAAGRLSADRCCRLSTLLMPQASARALALRAASGPAADPPPDRSIHASFTHVARRDPDRIAVSIGGEHWTYRTLDRVSSAVAGRLRERGVDAESAVGVMAPPSLEMIAGLLGALKAGAAYVPVEPALPQARQLQILSACACRVLLLGSGTEAPDAVSIPVLRIDRHDKGTARDARAQPNRLAYLMHTSGSTGNPKVVMIEHGAVTNLVQAFDDWRATSGRGLRWTVFHAFSFDLSVWEMFVPLLSGGQLTLVQAPERADTRRLADLLKRQQIEVLSLTPSTLQSLLGVAAPAGDGGPFATVRHLVIGGEALTTDIARRVAGLVPEAWNFYGPTEATVWAAACPLEVDDGRVALGGAIAGMRLEVMDCLQRPRPEGVGGELVIAGPGVARGYLGNPAATALAFRPDEVGHGRRVYLTGDRARALGPGRFEFLGRRDRQVKLRGYRVDLAEVERVLEGIDGVGQVNALLLGDSPASRQLVAFAVPAAGGALDERQLSRIACERLPAHMVPQAIRILPAMPRTRNGKTDHRALLALADAAPPPAVVASVHTEERVRQAWIRVLGHRRVETRTSFFDTGGHSLAMVQLQQELEQTFERPLALVDLYRWPTVSGMARFIDGAHAEPALVERAGPARQRIRDELRSRRTAQA